MYRPDHKQVHYKGDYHKVSKIGTGGYGKIYKVLSPGGSDAVIKCNMKYKVENNLSSARELNVNHTLGVHDYILPLTKITHQNPFSNDIMSPPTRPVSGPNININPVTEINNDMEMDKIQFVYPYAQGGNLRKYITDNRETITLPEIKRFMTEILLAMEYIHGTGFIHRDIKEENILIIKDKDGINKINIADFGHAKPFAKGMKQTPGIVSCWWRAPELCLGSSNYNQGIDMWSVGCVFYYMITGRHLTYLKTEDGNLLVNDIIKILPYHISSMDINSMNVSRFRVENSRLIPPSMDQFLHITTQGKSDMDTIGGYDNFCSLIRGLLSFNPIQRLTATKALNHPFFKDSLDQINSIRLKHPPIPIEYGPVQICDSVERKWAMSMAFGLYSDKSSASLSAWYTDRILFHSVSFFDLSLVHLSQHENKNIVISPYTGTIMSKKDAEILYLTCLYFSVKYFSSIHYPISYSSIVNKEWARPEDMLKIEKYETILVAEVLKYRIYRDTPYDYMCKNMNPTPEDVYSMLIMIFNGHHKGMTPKDSYERLWLQHKSFYMSVKM